MDLGASVRGDEARPTSSPGSLSTGPPALGSRTMINCRVLRPGRAPEPLDASGVGRHLADDATPGLIWFDVADPPSEELDFVAREFSLHPIAVEDMHHRDQR